MKFAVQINAEIDEQRRRYQPTRWESFFAVTKSLIIRGLIIYFISSFFRRPAPDTTSLSGSAVPAVRVLNMFENGTLLDLNVYMGESEVFEDFGNPDAHVWTEKNLIYGDWSSGPNNDGSRVLTHNFTPSDQLKRNGSIFLHVYVTKSGKSPDPNSGKGIYAGHYVSYARKMLNKFKKVKYHKRHNLLTGETTASEEEIKVRETEKTGRTNFLSFFHFILFTPPKFLSKNPKIPRKTLKRCNFVMINLIISFHKLSTN